MKIIVTTQKQTYSFNNFMDGINKYKAFLQLGIDASYKVYWDRVPVRQLE